MFKLLYKFWVAIAALFAPLKAVPRLFSHTSAIIEDVIGAVVLIFVVVALDVYVIGSQSIFNTTVGAPGYAITSVVVPILQVALLIVAIITAVMIIVHGAKTGGGK